MSEQRIPLTPRVAATLRDFKAAAERAQGLYHAALSTAFAHTDITAEPQQIGFADNTLIVVTVDAPPAPAVVEPSTPCLRCGEDVPTVRITNKDGQTINAPAMHGECSPVESSVHLSIADDASAPE